MSAEWEEIHDLRDKVDKLNAQLVEKQESLESRTRMILNSSEKVNDLTAERDALAKRVGGLGGLLVEISHSHWCWCGNDRPDCESELCVRVKKALAPKVDPEPVPQLPCPEGPYDDEALRATLEPDCICAEAEEDIATLVRKGDAVAKALNIICNAAKKAWPSHAWDAWLAWDELRSIGEGEGSRDGSLCQATVLIVSKESVE